MKTTVELPDDLARRVKEVARADGVTMRELVLAGLRAEIERRTGPRPHVDFSFRTVGGHGLSPGVEPHELTSRAYDLPT